MGELDLIKPYLEQHGEVLFGRLNMKPGKPTTFARIEKTLVFALPGNPVSCFVTSQLFVPLAIKALLSQSNENDLMNLNHFPRMTVQLLPKSI